MSFDWVGLEARANCQQCLLWSAAGSIHNIAMFFIFYTHVALPSKIFEGTSHRPLSRIRIFHQVEIMDQRYITADLLRSHKTFAKVQYLQWLISSSRRWVGKHARSQSVSQQMRSVKLVSSLLNCYLKDSSFGCFGFQVPEDRYKGKVATAPPQPHRCLSFCTSIYILETQYHQQRQFSTYYYIRNLHYSLDNGSRENVTLFWK